jgi:Asp-tRNA(Asn)/Glu-tRNA(Gln) amidotransferase A subunit family amidase
VNDSVRWSATKIAEVIRSGELSCEAIIQEHIARIEEANPKLNAVVQLCLERGLEEARAADQALAHGEVRGLLHGVPITIKDNLDTAGIISTGGTKGRKGFVPKYDALLERWSRFRTEMLRFIEPFDILLSPVLPFVALPHGTTFNNDRFPGFSYTMLHNLTGWPAAVVRAGTSKGGLPIGVQLAAKPWREDVALAVAHYLEAFGVWPEPSI